MKGTFKSVLLASLSAITLFGVVTLQSCEEDKCKSISCAFGGTCTEGKCKCATGYEGALCETATRTKFQGIWNVFEDGTLTDPAQYAVSIEPGAADALNQVKIKNMYNNFFTSIDAVVEGDSIKIPNQTKDNKIIEGYGYLAEDKYYGEHGKLVMIYKVKDGNLLDEFGTSPNTKSSLWNK